ncbi:PDZ domain-containing protein [Mucilaginibacter psychrotolerans]|uniref:PDZ domain-containing protein n=1 Tax=Mucilaginibacter psychrotolerans TaxID=1524096 RepID=A0A4Y8SJ26_9SPHI|nr:PDZ domain-containing protein [Mucilaginibacter psychrotolerans]TFF38517.1 PDZ domain-containing protein [Mucilaginibacter psychrotolerans]
MATIRTLTAAALFAVLLWPVHAAAQTNLYVSATGNDGNPGTRSKPVASISAALTLARKTPGAVFIRLFGGTYHLSKPVIFTPADSRKDNEPLVLTSVEHQVAVVSGSVALSRLNWTPYKNGIWQAKITQHLVFDELFVNGKLQHMARYPNYDASAQIMGGTAADAIGKGRAAKWASPAGGYVHALHEARWGDFHFLIKGKDSSGLPVLEGGWQNNRRSGMHERYRYVENVFEELDTANEWFYDHNTRILYYSPPKGFDLKTAKFETPQVPHLFEFRGTEEQPVKNITISALTLTQTARTFMQNKEPLLRSDWTIYRGGAVFYTGAVSCRLEKCVLENLGGNAVFFNKFNRGCEVSGCRISEIGASAICFVGDPAAVRSPSFEYNEYISLAKIDLTPGPKTNNYPKDCKVYDNLMFNLGYVEKQSAGVELSMCSDIVVSHNTIYDVPRAGINVSEGTWGGHIIEYNDIFNTVKETGDHGSFNSWGRDRYWQPDKKKLDSIVAENPGLALLDVVKPITLRYNRFRCDHGWDIDLDDGSSNYYIYNNLCLNGGIKLREGVKRVVENNIMVNNTFHPHVWFKNSGDIFRHNIVQAAYLPIGIADWGREIDYNAFPDSASLAEARSRGTDSHSVYGPLTFENSEKGDFRVKQGAAALSVGFKNFSMDSFGVVSVGLKKIAKKPVFPTTIIANNLAKDETIDFMGAKVKSLSTAGEQSATGMDRIRGVLVLSVAPGSAASAFLQTNDVILAFNRKQVGTLKELQEARNTVTWKNTEIVIFRNQQQLKRKMEVKM